MLLVVILAGLSVVERSVTAWPITTWPMYGRRTTPVPPPSASGLELRVLTRWGELHTLSRTDFFPMGMTGVAETAMETAFDNTEPALRDAYRSWVLQTAKRLVRADDVATIEGWRLEWSVEPLALPPLDRSRPVREVLLGRFSVAGDPESPRRP